MKAEESKKFILETFSEKNNSHAFILETNNIDLCLNDVIDIIRIINCSGDKSSSCECKNCKLIKSNSNPDLIVVKPDGKEIKKDQILNITNSFITKSILNTYSTYIIYEADKLNDTSANKLLKFLEEPEDGIIGFFITKKYEKIIPTIKSRCNRMKFMYEETNLLDLLDISEELFSKFYDYSINFIKLLNNNIKFELMLESKTLAKMERIDILNIFNLIKKIYVLKYQYMFHELYRELEFINSTIDVIDETDVIKLARRISLIDQFIIDFDVNVNKELFINKFILEWK